MSLFKHAKHPHVPVNINETIKSEKGTSLYARFNEKAGKWVTWIFSTMEMFWGMCLFIGVWMIGNGIGLWRFDPMPFLLLLMIINIPQLPLLPVLGRQQELIEKKQALMAEEQFNTATKTYHDTEQIMQHLDVQDDQLQGHTKDIQYIVRLVEELQSALLKQTALIEQARQQQP